MPLIRGIRATGLGGTTRNGLQQLQYVYRGNKPDQPKTPRPTIISHPCPAPPDGCGAQPGCRCRTADGTISTSYHEARREAAA